MNKFLIVFAVLAVLFLIQQHELLNIKGVNPNLILVAFLAVAFFQLLDLPAFIILLIIVFPVFVFLTGTFWFSRILIIEVLALAVYFLRGYLTGNKVLDFLIFVSASQVIFYLAANFGNFAFLPWSVLSAELVYNLILGAVFAFAFKSK